MASCVLVAFLILFLWFIYYFYRQYVLDNYFENFTVLRKLIRKPAQPRKVFYGSHRSLARSDV